MPLPRARVKKSLTEKKPWLCCYEKLHYLKLGEEEIKITLKID